MNNFNGHSTLISPNTMPTLYQDIHDMNYTPGALLTEEQSWAQGNVYWHNGSNTFNYSIFKMSPKENKAYIITTNFGNEEETVKVVDRLLSLLIKK
jgi:hypothetical protein